ncbi:MAG: T9SS type A sorting domain-containing protein, partial [Candidatus Marinimicrobia bacterium]|nr:T9SS type A sorting domain-containing protein [Candidatus Neomarinimicrobiota bacterium]
LLQKSFPGQLAEMSSYIGTNEVWSGGSADGSFGALRIVSGAWLEDEYDVVYHYGIGERPEFNQAIPEWYFQAGGPFFPQREAFTTITHFWDADGGPEKKTHLSDDLWDGDHWTTWSYDCENALQKMRKYVNGDYDFLWAYKNGIQSWDWCGINSLQLMTKFNVAGVVDFYNAREDFRAISYFGEDGQWHDTDCPNWDTSFTEFHKAHAYEILGRMCHLLQDMSVPCHVHCNSHACKHGMYCDYYENNELNYTHPTAEDIYNDGETFINPYNEIDDPIYFLMYFMNQIADHYADGKTDGDDNIPDERFLPYLEPILPTLGPPTTTAQINDANCRAMHEKLIKYAIRTTAGLLYWFAVETGQLPRPQVLSGGVTLTDDIVVSDGATLIISSNAIVNLNGHKVTSAGGLIIVERGAVIDPDIRLLSSDGVLIGLYPDMVSALDDALPGQVVELREFDFGRDVYVASGKTLRIWSGATINLNGHVVKSTGGTIIVESGADINPDIRLVEGSSIKGLYPSVELAIQEASNGDRVIASGVSKTCEDDFEVPGGITLELKGCNMKFDSGVWLKVLGALKADNSTFTRLGGSNWKGIRFYDSAVDSSCVIENSTISYADYGVYTFLSNPRIRNNTITNCTYGVYLNRSVASVTGNEISSCVRGVYGYRANCAKIVNNLITTGTSSISGLRFYDSEPEVYNNTIQGTFTYLLDADHYSRPTAIGPESQDYQGYNRMIGGSGATIYAHDHSEVVFGSGFIESTEGYAGYNTIYLDIQTDRIANVHAEGYSSVVAQHNWWGAYPPEGFFADGTSSIDHRDPLRSDPGGGSNLGKPAGNLLAGALNVNTYASTGKDILRVLLSEADWYWQNLCYRKAMERYKAALESCPDSPYAPMMLLRVAFAWRSLKEKGLEEFLSQFVRSGNKVLSTEAMELLIGENIRHGEIKKAIERAEYVISDNPGTEAEYKALFTLFNLYLNDLEDREKAEEILARMKMKYPDYPLTQMAQFDIGEPVEWKFPKPGEFGESPGVAGISPSSYWLGEGHPNPFNPTITIDFYLPEEAFVTLSIYDMLGREVRRLIDSRLGPGYNRVTWDGHGDSGEVLPNGVYICVFRSGGFKACRKMILLK